MKISGVDSACDSLIPFILTIWLCKIANWYTYQSMVLLWNVFMAVQFIWNWFNLIFYILNMVLIILSYTAIRRWWMHPGTCLMSRGIHLKNIRCDEYDLALNLFWFDLFIDNLTESWVVNFRLKFINNILYIALKTYL